MSNQIKNVQFSKKPIPIPVDYRPTYKIAHIVLILKLTCIGNKSSLLKLHLMNWALKNDNHKDQIINLINSNYNTDITVWGIEPAMNRALVFCVAENLCTMEGGKYKLTEKGDRFYTSIIVDKELFADEREFLTYIGKTKITEHRIETIANKWTLFNVKNQ